MAKHLAVKQMVLNCIQKMEPNQKFLSRQAMCQKFNISRSTADKVIGEIIADGWVYATKGSGTYVSPRLPGHEDDPVINAIAHSWGVIMPDVRYSIYPDMFKGIEDYAREHNINIMICNTDDDAQREYAYIQHLAATKVDGLLIVPARSNLGNLRNYRYLQERMIPFVFWNRSVDYMPEVPQVCLNGYYGGLLATRHLLQTGYKRIAFIAPARFRSSMDRFYGYCSALQDAAVNYDHRLVRLELPDEDPETVRKCARTMLMLPEPPDAFLCFIDKLAVPISEVIHDMGLKISDDIGLIGFESSITWTDANMQEKLTCIVISSYESGYYAGDILYRLMQHDSPPEQMLSVIHPRLMIRESCKGPIKPEEEHQLNGNQSNSNQN